MIQAGLPFPIDFNCEHIVNPAYNVSLRIRLTVAEIIVRLLKQMGVDEIVGVPGTTELRLIRAACDCDVKYRFAPHDGIAVGMADGFARASRRTAVANLHASQGVLNSAGLLRVALRDRVPMLVLVGTASTDYDIHEPNHFTHSLEQALAPLAKWVWTVNDASSVVPVMRRAIAMTTFSPQGPVVICVPQNILETEIEIESAALVEIAPQLATIQPTDAELQRATVLLDESERPLLFVGSGARHSREAVGVLSTMLSAPIIAEALGRGTQIHGVYGDYDHDLFAGYFDGNDEYLTNLLRDSDAIAFIGARATYPRVIGTLSHCRTLQITDAGCDIAKDYSPSAILLGDIPDTLHLLVRRLNAYPASRPSRNEVLSAIQNRRHALAMELIHNTNRCDRVTGYDLVAALNQTLPPNAVLVDDSQCFGYYIKRHFNVRKQTEIFGSLAGHIGWGLPAAIGVAKARDLPIVCVTGDAGLSIALSAIIAMQSDCSPVLVIVTNNHGSISLRTELDRRGWASPAASEVLRLFPNRQDFAAVATSVGIKSATASSSTHLRTILRELYSYVQSHHRPALVDVVMSDSIDDWNSSWSLPPTTVY